MRESVADASFQLGRLLRFVTGRNAVAIIVDDSLVSAPVMLTPSPSVVWIVTGLDEPGSRFRVDRLGDVIAC